MSTTTHRHSATAPPPPTIALPPRPSLDSFFSSAGISPGPMTLVSSFFADDSPSFSQLLAGAMASPLAFPPPPKEPNHHHDDHGGDGGDDHDDGSHTQYSPKKIVLGVGGFKQSRPMNLVVARSPLFTVPPGLSPSGFLNSPGFFSLSPQSPFGMSHQQALAQVTAQAVLAQSHIQMQADYQPPALTAVDESLDHNLPFTQNDAADKNLAPYVSETQSAQLEASEITHVDKKFQQPSLAIDKPADDGYNWRKYGQKQVKGSEYPRSYYKCTQLNCPVKKKVERALDGHITEIIYKGQHNHKKPQANRRTKDNNDSNENSASIQPKSVSNSQGWVGNSNNSGESLPDCSMLEGDQAFNQGAPRQLPGSSESEDVVDVDIREEEGDDSEPNPKRRNTNPGVSEVHQRTVTESKIIVQTRSKVDLLDDGYRWRKYGQKVVKGNHHPRSYYKCTSAGCSVRKHVERASTDIKAVITTYEGKHNHDVPASRNSSQNTAASASMPLKPHNVVPEKHPLLKDMDFESNDQRPIHLRLKEEQIIV